MSSCSSSDLAPSLLAVDNVSKTRLVDQLRQNVFLNNESLLKVVDNSIVKNMINSPQTQELLVHATIDESVNALHAKDQQQKVFVYQRLPKEEQDCLRKTFHMFNLDFTKATDCSGHPFWRAHRLLSEKKMIRQAGIRPGSKPVNGYDVVYKDVGGNPGSHLNRGELYVHTCAPLLSNNDDKRHSAYKERLRRETTRTRNDVYNLHIERNSQVICTRKSQNCCIKAEVLIFLHSAYDMSLVDIANSMHRADARVAYGCVHFNPRILYEKEGSLRFGMCFKKIVVNGKVKIRFWYENDNQEGYEHDFVSYLSLVRSFRIASTSPSPRYYNVQFDTTDDDTAFFVIRQSISGTIPKSNPFRVFTNSELADKMLVYTWHWDTLNPGNVSTDTVSRMRPVRLIVPRKLFYKMCSFADTLPESKFTIKNILIAGTSFNTREVISGQSIGVVDPIEPSALKMLAVAVFVITYISNYECTKALSAMVDDEDRVRKESSQNWFGRIFRVKHRLPWNHRVQKFQKKMGQLISEISTFEEKITSEEDPNTTNMRKVIDTVRDWASVDRKFKIVIERMCNFLTVEEELDCLTIPDIPCDRGFVSDSPLMDFIDPETVREAVVDCLESMKVPETLFDSSSFTKSHCSSDLEVVHNSSNGDCVFQSMVDSGTARGLTAKKLRRQLLESSYMVNLRNSVQQRKLLSCMDGSKEGYGDMDTFILFSLEFQQGVCVHVNAQNLTFGEPPYRHFLIAENHCSFLKPSHSFDSIPTYTLAESVDEITYSSSHRDAQFENFFNLRSQYSRSQYNKRLSLAKKNYCPLSELGDGNYVCRSGMKTAEMFERYFSQDYLSAVSVGGPGGEVQYLCERGIRTFGITKTDLIDFSPSITSHLFTQLLGDTYDGDITKLQNIISFRDEVRALYPSGVCFYGGDAATAEEHGANLDLAQMSQLISWEILCLSVTLRKGGDAYIKVFDLLSHGMLRNLHFLAENFRRFEIVKLETSRSASTELHVICRDFLLNNSLPSVAHSKLVELGLPVPRTFYHNMCHAQKYFDGHIVKGLRQYRRAFDTAGERNEVVNRFPEDKLEGYRNVLCLPTRVSAGGLLNTVKRTFRKIYSDVNSNSRDLTAELNNYSYVDVDIISVESFATALEEFDDRVVCPGIECDLEEGVEVLVGENVDSYFNIFPERTVVKTAKKEKLDPFFVSTEADGTFTEIGQTRPTGITCIPFKNSLPKPSFSLKVGTSTDSSDETLEEESVEDQPVFVGTYRDAMRECLELAEYTLSCQISNHARILERLNKIPLKSTFLKEEVGVYSYMVYSGAHGVRLLFGAPIGSRTFNKFFFKGTFHSSRDMNTILRPGDNYLVSDYCEIALEQELITTYKTVDIESFVLPDGIGFVQAGPGCGKTTFVVNNTIPPHMPTPTNVLLATIEGKNDFIDRLQKKYDRVFTKTQLVHIRTLASFLVNYKRNVKSGALIVDEALMSHPGQIFFAVALSGASEVKLLGDMLQIPYVNRTPAFKTRYDKLSKFVSVSETLYISYRCPSDVVARLNPEYLKCNIPNGVNYGLLSTHYAANTCKIVRLSNDNFPKDSGVQYLVFTQSEKTKLASLKLKVSTVHEFQGKEARHIRVVRLNPYPQEEIFLRFNYALVALTRHTESLVYYTRVVTDSLSDLIKVDGIICHTAMSEDENRSCVHVAAGALTEVFRIARDLPSSTCSTISAVPTHISRVQDSKLYFVPRFGWKPDCKFKPPVMSSEVILDHSRGHLTFFVVSSEAHTQKHNLTTITRNLRRLAPMISDMGVRRLYVSGEVEKDVDRASLGYQMHKNIRAKAYLCSSSDVYDIPSEVFDLLTRNGLCELPNSTFESIGFEVADIVPTFKICHEFSVESAQAFLNNFFGECVLVDQSFDAWDVRNSDLNIEVGEVSFSPVGCVQLNKVHDSMRPVIKSPMPHMRDYNMRELTLALEKRNRNVPYMNGVVDFEESSELMLESLIRECFDQSLLDFHRAQPITISMNSVGEWLSGQPTPVRGMIVPDFALHCSALNAYSFSIKRKPKPNLTVDAAKSYLALQTIVYHEKPINAMFCSVFREIKKRVTSSLLPHVKIFCDMSSEEFEEVLNRDVPACGLSKFLEKLEIDISKYDKSQRELALEFECKLMRYFGVSEDMIELWFNAHVLTEIYDRTTKLKALIPYQRKSGDASTFIGNTLFLMAVVCDLVPVSELELALFSGDDSLLYGFCLDKCKDSQHFGLKFNLEIKFFKYELSYFCSKFLLVVNGKWKFTPDPVKFMTKLGRHDMVNPAHVEEYRVSFIDTVRNYSDYCVCMHVAEALRERYGIVTDHTAFLSSMSHMTTKENFSKLFYSEVGDRIDNSVVFSRDD